MEPGGPVRARSWVWAGPEGEGGPREGAQRGGWGPGLGTEPSTPFSTHFLTAAPHPCNGRLLPATAGSPSGPAFPGQAPSSFKALSSRTSSSTAGREGPGLVGFPFPLGVNDALQLSLQGRSLPPPTADRDWLLPLKKTEPRRWNLKQWVKSLSHLSFTYIKDSSKIGVK